MTNDAGSAVRNVIGAILAGRGFTNTHTGTWEIESADPAVVSGALGALFEVLAHPQTMGNGAPGAALQNLSIWVDSELVPVQLASNDE
jgi:hypothetical protein